MGYRPAVTRFLSSSGASVYLALVPNPISRAASTTPKALVPRIVESHRTRSSLSGLSTPKLSRIILRQAGTQEKRVSCLWKGGLDGIAVLFGQQLGCGQNVFNRRR